MLEALVSSHSAYSRQLENGVLHVFERSLVRRSPESLADNYLFEKVREVVRPTGIPGIAGNLSSYSGELKVRIQTHNDSVRETLNKIVTTSKMKIWIATFPEKQPLTVQGFFEATPLFDSRYVLASVKIV